jgi:hypothetical protein
MVHTDDDLIGQQWVIKNRLAKSEPCFLMKIAGMSSSHSVNRCL